MLKGISGVTVVEEENVPETIAVAKSMESMINLDGAELIFATSFGYYNPFVLDLAAKYPDVQFRHAAPLWTDAFRGFYRLYCLAGGPPLRPGLVRDSGGNRIDLELWALPEHQFGAFLRGIPAPLGIGTVQLEDGSAVNGFVCEGAGLEDAVEITRYGGWRGFLQSAGQGDTA